MSCFLSYSRADGDVADAIALRIEGAGLEVWRDVWDTRAGDEFPEKIVQALERADACVVLISARSVASCWVRFELERVLELREKRPGYRLIPVLVDSTPLPVEIETLIAPKWQPGNEQWVLDQILDGLSVLVKSRNPAGLSRPFPLPDKPWTPQILPDGTIKYPVYIFALDPPLSASHIDFVGPHARPWAEAYGQAMIKLVLLSGGRPVLSENQVIDGRAVLDAAMDPEFRVLVEEGHIILSFRDDEQTYEDALIRFLAQKHKITSAWAHLDRAEMLDVLRTRRDPSWDSVSGGLLEAFRQLNGLRLRPEGKAVLRPAALTDRILPCADNLPALMPEAGVGEVAQRLLRTIYASLTDTERSDRSAWVQKAISSEFVERYVPEAVVGIRELAVTIALNSYQEIVCRSVAGGNALRTVASVPASFGDTTVPDLAASEFQLLNFMRGGLLEAPGDINGEVIEIRKWEPPSEENVLNVAAIPWSAIREVVNHPQFAQYVRGLRVSSEGRDRYYDWLDMLWSASRWRQPGGTSAVAAVLGSARGRIAVDEKIAIAGLDPSSQSTEILRQARGPVVVDGATEIVTGRSSQQA